MSINSRRIRVADSAGNDLDENLSVFWLRDRELLYDELAALLFADRELARLWNGHGEGKDGRMVTQLGLGSGGALLLHAGGAAPLALYPQVTQPQHGWIPKASCRSRQLEAGSGNPLMQEGAKGPEYAVVCKDSIGSDVLPVLIRFGSDSN
jgi:hypothetical protein